MSPTPQRRRRGTWWLGPAILAVLGAAVGVCLVVRTSVGETGLPTALQVGGPTAVAADRQQLANPQAASGAASSGAASSGGPDTATPPSSPTLPSAPDAGSNSVGSPAESGASTLPVAPGGPLDQRAAPAVPIPSAPAAVVSRRQPVLSGDGPQATEPAEPPGSSGTDD